MSLLICHWRGAEMSSFVIVIVGHYWLSFRADVDIRTWQLRYKG
jgi:hypothetical protein